MPTVPEEVYIWGRRDRGAQKGRLKLGKHFPSQQQVCVLNLDWNWCRCILWGKKEARSEAHKFE